MIVKKSYAAVAAVGLKSKRLRTGTQSHGKRHYLTKAAMTKKPKQVKKKSYITTHRGGLTVFILFFIFFDRSRFLFHSRLGVPSPLLASLSTPGRYTYRLSEISVRFIHVLFLSLSHLYLFLSFSVPPKIHFIIHFFFVHSGRVSFVHSCIRMPIHLYILLNVHIYARKIRIQV